MRRREFSTLLAGASTVWPFAARTQQEATPVIGYLGAGTPGAFAQFVAAFRQGLSEAGYSRDGDPQVDRLAGRRANLAHATMRHLIVY